MTDNPGRRGTPLADPTAERTSEPVPAGEDVLARQHPRHSETPRRYEEDVDHDREVMPSPDSRPGDQHS